MGNLIRPIVRFIIGMLAIPAFRFVLKRVFRLQELNAELEKDLEQWFKCSLMLLVSTQFMEPYLFSWLLGNPADIFHDGAIDPFLMGLRILLAIGVIELMPDQELFSIVHPGPKLKYDRSLKFWPQVCQNCKPFFRGLLCQHINRSSPVFAILAALLPSPTASVVCYVVAITQYLIIGLVTSRDRALDVLSEFDRQVAIRRRQIIEEFRLDDSVQAADDRERVRSKANEVPSTASRTQSTSSAAPSAGVVAKADDGEYESH